MVSIIQHPYKWFSKLLGTDLERLHQQVGDLMRSAAGTIGLEGVRAAAGTIGLARVWATAWAVGLERMRPASGAIRYKSGLYVQLIAICECCFHQSPSFSVDD